MNKSKALVMVMLVAIAGGAAFWWLRMNGKAPPAPVAAVSPVVQASPTPAIRYPIEDQPTAASGAAATKAVPTVDESDPTLEEALAALFGKSRLEALLNLKDIVRRFVVTVDNATGQKQPSQELSLVKPLESDFQVSGKGEELTIAAANSGRYAPYVALAGEVDARKLVSLYRHYYRLFQTAYQDLGTTGYFNDRLVAVIDDALKAPEPAGPIRLVRPAPHSRFKYADDNLENLSVAQKALIRMGSGNARVIKEKLRRIRALLVQRQEH